MQVFQALKGSIAKTEHIWVDAAIDKLYIDRVQNYSNFYQIRSNCTHPKDVTITGIFPSLKC